MKKKHQKTFNHYIRVGEILSKMFGADLEIVIHDWSNPKASVIAIYNGAVTGRKVGDPTSDVGLKRIKGEIESDTINYLNKTPSGDLLKSSSLSIRDDNDKIIGVFSLNWKIQKFQDLMGLIGNYVTVEKKSYIEESESFFHLNPEEEVKLLIHEELKKSSNQILNKKERIELIHTLFKKGFFNKKRSIDIVATKLGVSRPTVYKYIAQFENEKLNEGT